MGKPQVRGRAVCPRARSLVGRGPWNATLRTDLPAMLNRPCAIGISVLVVVVVVRRPDTPCMPSVETHAAPIPTAAIKPDAPIKRCPRIIPVPRPREPHGRPPIVAPAAVKRAPKHEVAMHVVVARAGPPNGGIALDGLGIRVHVRDDGRPLTVRERLMADGIRISSLVFWLCMLLLLDSLVSGRSCLHSPGRRRYRGRLRRTSGRRWRG